MSRCRYPSQPV